MNGLAREFDAVAWEVCAGSVALELVEEAEFADALGAIV